MIANKPLTAALVAALAGYGAWSATVAAAQRPEPAGRGRALVLDGVTVVDVEQGQLLPDERVVIFNTGSGIKYLECFGGQPSAVPL